MRRAEKIGIDKFTFHDIRAKSASDSTSLEEAPERLGHTSTAITDRVTQQRGHGSCADRSVVR